MKALLTQGLFFVFHKKNCEYLKQSTKRIFHHKINKKSQYKTGYSNTVIQPFGASKSPN